MKKLNLILLLIFTALLGIYFFYNPEKSEIKETSVEIINKKEELSDIVFKYANKFEKLCPEGIFSVYLEDLNTDKSLCFNNIQMKSASVIKLFIAKEAFADFNSLSGEEKDKLDLMITQSDNECANYFIDKFGGTYDVLNNSVNKSIVSGNYKDTLLGSKMYDEIPADYVSSGYSNLISAKDTGALLSSLYHKKLNKEPYDTEFLKLLENQKIRWKIPSKITEKYPEITVYNKTGELSDVENDAAIICGKNFNIVLIILVNNIPKTPNGECDYYKKEEVQNFMGDVALNIVEHFNG